ncbi:MAG TPA: histidine phosphatase family protein [Nocardioides sp.]|nr:histidine phosphatase family protein [Nocardioides sp.]
MSSPRTLVVIRHAKAESMAPTDAERSLTERGRADARALGALLRDDGLNVEAALVSDATRARETWEQLAGAAGWDLPPQIDGSLYSADEDGVLERVREVPGDVRTVVVVGHNPTVSMLVQLLDDGEGSEADLSGMPTGAAAVLDLGCAWSEVGPVCAHLRAFHVGRADD